MIANDSQKLEMSESNIKFALGYSAATPSLTGATRNRKCILDMVSIGRGKFVWLRTADTKFFKGPKTVASQCPIWECWVKDVDDLTLCAVGLVQRCTDCSENHVDAARNRVLLGRIGRAERRIQRQQRR